MSRLSTVDTVDRGIRPRRRSNALAFRTDEHPSAAPNGHGSRLPGTRERRGHHQALASRGPRRDPTARRAGWAPNAVGGVDPGDRGGPAAGGTPARGRKRGRRSVLADERTRPAVAG